ncbi:hypothetical protein AAH979_37920 [Plantactinospora sp. ZYX-F-223]|uniref:hypothetical protein n=1 Tax=Plantactinospora sp. ZYX-F-223 TaxID=3144103 RepID=UPI0031FDCC8F
MVIRTYAPGRKWWRSAVLSTLTVAASAGLVVLVEAAPAAASPGLCIELGARDWEWVPSSPERPVWESYDYLSFNSTPTFNVSDTRIAVNNLDTPASVTFTSQQSQTFSVSVSASMKASLLKKLELTVGSNVQWSRTTAVGVSVTATVPPRSGIRGDYGVQAYDVTFEAQTWGRRTIQIGYPPSRIYTCEDLGVRTYHINAPTDLEGWRVGPL